MQDTTTAILVALHSSQWLVAGALSVGLLVALAKSGRLSMWLAMKVPPKYLPYEAMALGVLGVGSTEVLAGKPVKVAIVDGFLSAIFAISGHDLVIEAARGGKEIIPKTLAVWEMRNPIPPSPYAVEAPPAIGKAREEAEPPATVVEAVQGVKEDSEPLKDAMGMGEKKTRSLSSLVGPSTSPKLPLPSSKK
jgi:hypothetical protein